MTSVIRLKKVMEAEAEVGVVKIIDFNIRLKVVIMERDMG